MSSSPVYVSHDIRDHFFRKIRSLPGNRMCFDCNRRNPTWATVSFGVFLCLDCSGYHRRLGVHISFVRSTDMDEWTEEQLKIMQIGGNHEARKFFKQHGVVDMTNIEEKYRSKAAQLYRTILAKNVKNPTLQLIKLEESTNTKENDVDGLDALMKGLGTNEANDKPKVTTSIQTPVIPPVPTYMSTSVNPSVTVQPQIGTKPIEPVKVVQPVIFASQSSANSQPAPVLNFTAPKAQKLSGAVKLQGSFDFEDLPVQNAAVPAATSVIQESKSSVEQQIKDDEALAKALQEAETGGFSDSFETRPLSSLGTQPTFVPQAVPQENLNKYKDAKSISSDNYFSAEQQVVDTQRLNQFSGAQSISSDAYYGRESTASNDAVDEAAYQISQLKNVIGDKAGKIKNITSNFFSDLQSRYT